VVKTRGSCGVIILLSRQRLLWWCLCSFSNLFSPSNRLTAKQQSVPDVRYSTLQGADNGVADDQASQSQSYSMADRSSRIVRFRDEDMYLQFEFCFSDFLILL